MNIFMGKNLFALWDLWAETDWDDDRNIYDQGKEFHRPASL